MKPRKVVNGAKKSVPVPTSGKMRLPMRQMQPQFQQPKKGKR